MKVNDFVFVSGSCGPTPGIARITKITRGASPQADMIFDNGQTAAFYVAYLNQNAECLKRRRAFLEARASKIGVKA